MSENMKETFEEADLEIVKNLKTCRMHGPTDVLPESPTSGDVFFYTPIDAHLIFIENKWYALRAPENEDSKDDKERNSVVQGLFDVLDWVMLPHRLYEPVEKAIDLLEKDRETIYELKNAWKRNVVVTEENEEN